jgi:hypothetical protein
MFGKDFCSMSCLQFKTVLATVQDGSGNEVKIHYIDYGTMASCLRSEFERAATSWH